MSIVGHLRRKAERDMRWRPWLEVVGDSDFQNRIRTLDPDYVAVFNRHTDMYEIHSLGAGSETLCITVPWPMLDDRTIEKLWRTSYKYQGDVGKKMRDRNESVKAGKKREYDREIEARARDAASEIGYAVESDELHDSYSRTHVVGGMTP